VPITAQSGRLRGFFNHMNTFFALFHTSFLFDFFLISPILTGFFSQKQRFF